LTIHAINARKKKDGKELKSGGRNEDGNDWW
jgi:hypothetical protein